MSFRNLEVPYFSQRKNNSIWYEHYPLDSKKVDENGKSLAGKLVPNGKTDSKAKNSCNITCLAMVLHYFGITKDTPDEMMKKVFNPPEKELKTYSALQKSLVTKAYTDNEFFESAENLKDFADYFYHAKTEVYDNKKLVEIENEILAGYPVIVSCGLLRDYEESKYIPDCKKAAYAESFYKKFEKVKETDYDNKIQEYNTQITEKNNLLEDTNTSTEDKSLLKKQIEEIQQARLNLENNYQKKLDYRLDDYRFHGHFIVIRGVKDKGVIINDPWGKPSINKYGKGEYYTMMDGDNIYLSKDAFDKQYFHDGHFWSCLIIREKRWNFISRNKDYLVTNDKFLENCRKAELFEFGGYPIKRSNLWHNGLHFSSKIGNEIYPIGPGQLIAARIVNKGSNGIEPVNGSCCFVLIKHQILDKDNNLKDFFACYMHLKPIRDLDKIVDLGQKTNIKWLDEIIERTKKVRQIKYGIDDTSYYSEEDKNGDKKIGNLPDSAIIQVDSINDDEKKIYFYYEIDNAVNKYWVRFSNNILSRSDNSTIYKKLLDELKTGKVVYFNDKDLLTVDSMIEVTNSSPIGFMGKYGGYNDELKKTLHFEIFSNDILVEKIEGFTVIREIELPPKIRSCSAMCNRKDMIAFFENKKLYGSFSFQFLEKDGVITKKEMINFYNSKDGAEKFQNYIIQHISEWSDKIDWNDAFEKSKGVPTEGLGALFSNDKIVETLDDYIKHIYEPYKWFNSDCIKAMNTNSTLFNKGYATFYHPVRFIKWLDENKK